MKHLRLWLLCVMLTMAGAIMAATTYTADPAYPNWTIAPTTKWDNQSPTLWGDGLLKVLAANSNGSSTFLLRVQKDDDSKIKNRTRTEVRVGSPRGTMVGSSETAANSDYTVVSFKATHTSGSRKYYVVLISYLPNGNTRYYYTNPITVTATTTKLATPNAQSFEGENPLYNCFTATWDPVEGATGYRINVRRASETYEESTIPRQTTNTNSCQINGLAGNAYQFQVQATVGSDQSAWSNWSPSGKIIKTLSNMSISSGNTFGSSTLQKSTSSNTHKYTYTVTVKNNASYNWFGSFRLEGAEENYEWLEKVIKAGESKTFTCEHEFTTTGTKVMQLKIMQGARGDWEKFGNSFTVTVTDQATPSGGGNELEDAVTYLHGRGIIEGSTVSAANTDNPLYRKHIAKMAFLGVYKRASSVPSSIAPDNYPTIYDDLAEENSDNSYYFRAARALLYLEYGDGVAPFDRNRLNFNPGGTITRLHTLKVLMETFNIKPDVTGTNNPYPQDAAVTSLMSKDKFMMGYIRRAYDENIISHQINKWNPNDPCKRGDAMLMLYRIMQKVDAGNFSPNPNTGYFQPLNTTLKTISQGAGLQMGNFQHYTKTSFAIDGTVPLEFAHSYNSYNTTLPDIFNAEHDVDNGKEAYLPLADGWSHNYHSYIVVFEVSDNLVQALVHWGGGNIDAYERSGSGEYNALSLGVYDKLLRESSGLYVKTKSQVEYHFDVRQIFDEFNIYYLSSVNDRNGNTLTIEYQTGENDMKRISRVGDGSGRWLTFSYKSNTNLLESVSDPLERSIGFEYDYNRYTGRYQLKTFTDAKGNKTTYSYVNDKQLSTSKLLKSIRLPKGNYINNDYDGNSRLTRTENGDSETTVNVTSTYGNSGNSASTTSKVNVKRSTGTSTYRYEFDGNNVMTSITSPQNSNFRVSVTPYTTVGMQHLPKSIITHSTNISYIEYDDRGNVLSVEVTGDGKTLTTYYTYNTDNTLKSVTDPMNNTTRYYYTNGNLRKIESPISGITTNIARLDNGLIESITNPEGIKTEYGYNSYGNLESVTQTLPTHTLNLIKEARYDAVSRLRYITDALNRTYRYEYDANDNPIKETTPKDYITRYYYDDNDNLERINNAKQEDTNLEYDFDTDRLMSVSYGGATKSYTYNNDGTFKSYTKSDRFTTLNYKYDALGRLTDDGINTYGYDSQTLRLKTITSKEGGKKLSMDYDGFGRVTRTTFDGRINNYQYDDNGNCKWVNDTEYGYDNLNRLIWVKFNGKTINYTYLKDNRLSKVEYPNGMTTTYVYDAVGRLTGKNTKLGNGTVIAAYNFELDDAGNIKTQTANEPYDGIVIQNQNITYNYNNGNRITRAGDVSYEIDNNGNTTKCGSERYEWDKGDRLTKAGTTDITYDPLGNITSYGNITFTVDPLGIGNVLSDSKGADYIYGNGLEARVKNGKVSYYVTDFRGSVVAMVDESGNITHKYQYDEFGKVTQKEEADYNPFQYVGKYGVMYLNEHQYYMRARHYDPTIGRFLSEDPIWSTNLYPYADNNPIMKIDPRGLTPEDEARLAEINTEIEKLNEKMDFIYMFSKKEEYKGLQDQTKESLRTQYNESHIKWEKLTLEKYQLYAKIAKESASKLHGHTINLSYGKPSSNEKKTVNEGKTGRISISEKGLSESFPYDTSNMDNSALLDKLVNANKEGVANGMGILQVLQ